MPDDNQPGVTLQLPAQALAGASIPVRVAMVADMVTWHATHGVLDNALEVMLVRRDRPGVVSLLKLDPRALMLPETPLPPPDRDPASDPARIREERVLDPLDYGASHDGAADYHVMAFFARWWSGPYALSVVDRTRRLPTAPCPAAPASPEALSTVVPRTPDRAGVTAATHAWDDGLRIDGTFRVTPRPAEYPRDGVAPPFVTVLAARLEATGGATARSFVVPATTEGGDHVGRFSIPLRAVLDDPAPGRWSLWVFSGDEVSTPFDVDLR